MMKRGISDEIDNAFVTSAGVKNIPFAANGPEKNVSSNFVSVLSLLNTMIGAGILALPFVISRLGILIGTSVFVLVTFSTTFSLYLMLQSARISKFCDYRTISFLCFGRFGEYFLKLALVLGNFSTNIIYLTVFSTSMSLMARNFFSDICNFSQFLCGKTFFLLSSTLITTQFVFKKTTEKLKFASFFGVSLHLLFCLILFYAFFKLHFGSESRQVDLMTPKLSLTQGIKLIPTVFGAFECQTNFYSVVSCMKKPTQKNIMKVILITMSIGSSLYLLVAIAAYSCFGKNTKGNIAESYMMSDVGAALFYLLNFCVGLPILFVFPMQFFLARDYILQFSYISSDDTYVCARETEPNNDNPSNIGKAPEEQTEQTKLINQQGATTNPVQNFHSKYTRIPQWISLKLFKISKYGKGDSRHSDLIKFQRKALFNLTSFLYLAVIVASAIFLQDYFLEAFNLGSLITQTFTGFIFPIANYLRLEGKRHFLYYFSIFFLFLIVALNLTSLLIILIK